MRTLHHNGEKTDMVLNTVKIDGMACGMCEAHITDTIRKVFPDAKKVAASHKKGTATFLTESPVDVDKLSKAIEDTGYHYKGYDSEPYEKKHGLFGFGK